MHTSDNQRDEQQEEPEAGGSKTDYNTKSHDIIHAQTRPKK
jgi:hypothetical protein